MHTIQVFGLRTRYNTQAPIRIIRNKILYDFGHSCDYSVCRKIDKMMIYVTLNGGEP